MASITVPTMKPSADTHADGEEFGRVPNVVIIDLTGASGYWERLLDTCGWATTVSQSIFGAIAQAGAEADCIVLRVPDRDDQSVAELTQQVRQRLGSADVPIIAVVQPEVLNGADQLTSSGAADFVVEPLLGAELIARVNQQVCQRKSAAAEPNDHARIEERLQRHERALRSALERMVDTERQLNKAHADTVRRLGVASEYKDEDTGEHISRVGAYARLLARGIGMGWDEAETLREASALHDVGKIGIPDAILLKPGKLDADEWKVMKTHTTIGVKILTGSKSHLLQLGETLALTHHEKWDGSGYPNGIVGEAIPIEGRICAIADFFDAVSSDRPYRNAMPEAKVFGLLKEGRGIHFDPELLQIFFDRMEEVTRIRDQYRERNLLRSRRYLKVS